MVYVLGNRVHFCFKNKDFPRFVYGVMNFNSNGRSRNFYGNKEEKYCDENAIEKALHKIGF